MYLVTMALCAFFHDLSPYGSAKGILCCVYVFCIVGEMKGMNASMQLNACQHVKRGEGWYAQRKCNGSIFIATDDVETPPWSRTRRSARTGEYAPGSSPAGKKRTPGSVWKTFTGFIRDKLTTQAPKPEPGNIIWKVPTAKNS